MVPAGNKAKRLSSVNHTTKTIHHHHQKTLTTEKISTKNPQIKQCPCRKCVTIYRPDLSNLQTKKKAVDNVSKN